MTWFLMVLGLICVVAMACSGKVRRRVKYFISTNFYVNKYEYRDEWLAFSSLLQGALSESEVVAALRYVLADSLYTNIITIWVGDEERGFRTVGIFDSGNNKEPASDLLASDPLLAYLKEHNYFCLDHKEAEKSWQDLAAKKAYFFTAHNLVLIVPMTIGEQMVGLIGLGPEFTGDRYDLDDFDLLATLGTQAASALLAGRLAAQLAETRERRAWDDLSAFVLHDVKNAASMLFLVRQNAPRNISDPEFQHDMLITIDDALQRMAKVQSLLSQLRQEVIPALQQLELDSFMKESRGRLTTSGSIDQSLMSGTFHRKVRSGNFTKNSRKSGAKLLGSRWQWDCGQYCS